MKKIIRQKINKTIKRLQGYKLIIKGMGRKIHTFMEDDKLYNHGKDDIMLLKMLMEKQTKRIF